MAAIEKTEIEEKASLVSPLIAELSQSVYVNKYSFRSRTQNELIFSFESCYKWSQCSIYRIQR